MHLHHVFIEDFGIDPNSVVRSPADCLLVLLAVDDAKENVREAIVCHGKNVEMKERSNSCVVHYVSRQSLLETEIMALIATVPNARTSDFLLIFWGLFGFGMCQCLFHVGFNQYRFCSTECCSVDSHEFIHILTMTVGVVRTPETKIQVL